MATLSLTGTITSWQQTVGMRPLAGRLMWHIKCVSKRVNHQLILMQDSQFSSTKCSSSETNGSRLGVVMLESSLDEMVQWKVC